ncbi:DUF58 domain-containing protein [Butyrivibrio sp. INlla21]|uniref:DUF58 domain-containing protein n=1 Tax=Butyrivibrio sp. INlla21 TaxID=1520811 RepID=UPI0008E513AE|nr:DUF58 domain-containing protein [Butyrivibrio sp. INlla21]SFU69757.1 Protein of unknown function DUF58 [Butyrivibrio sp. INlla21]
MRITFHKKGVCLYLVFLIASLVFSSFFGGAVSFVWLYAMLLLIPVSFAYIFVNYKFLSIYQTMDVHKVLKGDEHEFTLALENDGVLPIHRMKLTTYVDRCVLKDIEDGTEVSLDSFNRKELKSGLSCRYAGAYDVGAGNVSFTDPFGIFTVRFKVPYNFRAIVSPRITDVGDGIVDIENIVNSTGLKSTVQNEDIPGSDMRAYEKGDSISSINWKISAKLGELVVRLPDKKEKRTLTMILEAADVPEIKWDTQFLKDRDRFLELIVSCAFNFAGQGVPVKLIYPSATIREKTVNSYESFLEFYNTVADGIFYSSDAEVTKLKEMITDRSSYGDETIILIRERPKSGEEYCAVI